MPCVGKKKKKKKKKRIEALDKIIKVSICYKQRGKEKGEREKKPLE